MLTNRLIVSLDAASPAERFTAAFGVGFAAMLHVIAPSTGTLRAIAVNIAVAAVVLHVFPRLRAVPVRIVRFAAIVLPTIAFYLFYKQCSLVLHSGNVAWRDADLTQVGEWLTAPMQAGASPAMTEWLAFCYVVYAPLTVVSALALARGVTRLREAERQILAMCVMLAACYVLFVLFPVRGPRLVDPSFQSGRMGDGIFSMIALANQQYGMLFGAAFPSAHVAGAVVLLVPHAWRRSFWFIAPIAVTIPVSTVYFGYHYVADAVIGAIVGLLVCSALGYNRDAVARGRLVLARVIPWVRGRPALLHERGQ
jgi:membrane-associated phospholipid phosphatase